MMRENIPYILPLPLIVHGYVLIRFYKKQYLIWLIELSSTESNPYFRYSCNSMNSRRRQILFSVHS